MSITIHKWLDDNENSRMAFASLNGNEMKVKICSYLDAPLNESLSVEFNIEEIIKIEKEPNCTDEKSGIWQTPHGFQIIGKIHNIIELSGNSKLYDVYIQNGPEFIVFEGKEIYPDMEVNDFISLYVSDLLCYPVNY